MSDETITSDNGEEIDNATHNETPAHVQFSVVFDDSEDDNELSATAEELTLNSSEPSESTESAEDEDGKAAPDKLAGTLSDETQTSQATTTQDEEQASLRSHTDHTSVEPAMSVASRIDRELKKSGADDVLLRSYPTFAADHITVTNRKSGRHLLDNIDWRFYAGRLYAIDLNDCDDEQHRTILSVFTGFTAPSSGQMMIKSSSFKEIESSQLLGYRIGFVPQRYALREDLDATQNLTHAMDASGRTFLKPKVVLARELLRTVKFTGTATGIRIGELSALEQRKVALARAIACEASIVIIDEPTVDLNEEEQQDILSLLAGLAHNSDPKRCVIMLTSSQDNIDAADEVMEV